MKNISEEDLPDVNDGIEIIDVCRVSMSEQGQHNDSNSISLIKNTANLKKEVKHKQKAHLQNTKGGNLGMSRQDSYINKQNDDMTNLDEENSFKKRMTKRGSEQVQGSVLTKMTKRGSEQVQGSVLTNQLFNSSNPLQQRKSEGSMVVGKRDLEQLSNSIWNVPIEKQEKIGLPRDKSKSKWDRTVLNMDEIKEGNEGYDPIISTERDLMDRTMGEGTSKKGKIIVKTAGNTNNGWNLNDSPQKNSPN